MQERQLNIKRITSYKELRDCYYCSSLNDEVVVEVRKLIKSTGLLKLIKYSCFIARTGVRKIRFDVSELDENTVNYFLMNLKCCLVPKETYICEGDDILLISSKVEFEKKMGWGIVCGDSEEDKLSLLEIYNSLREKSDIETVALYVCCSELVKRELENRLEEVNWVLFETNETPFPISKKKNFLLENMNEDVFLIQHTRIRCSVDVVDFCFNHHFDLFSPVVTCGNRRYLDLIFYKMTRKKTAFLPFAPLRVINYLMKKYSYYIDGALFVGKKSSLGGIRLNNSLSWGEAEDVNFCSVLLAQYVFVDLVPLVNAKSITYKTRKSFSYYFTFLKFFIC